MSAPNTLDPMDFDLLDRSEAFLADWLTAALLEATTDEAQLAFQERAKSLLADLRNRRKERAA